MSAFGNAIPRQVGLATPAIERGEAERVQASGLHAFGRASFVGQCRVRSWIMKEHHLARRAGSTSPGDHPSMSTHGGAHKLGSMCTCTTTGKVGKTCD